MVSGTYSARKSRTQRSLLFPVQTERKLDVKADPKLAFDARVLGHRHAFPSDTLETARYADLIQGDLEFSAIQGCDLSGMP